MFYIAIVYSFFMPRQSKQQPQVSKLRRQHRPVSDDKTMFNMNIDKTLLEEARKAATLDNRSAASWISAAMKHYLGCNASPLVSMILREGDGTKYALDNVPPLVLRFLSDFILDYERAKNNANQTPVNVR